MTMKKGNIIIQYQIDLEIYKKVKRENYYHFSKSEIVENMLWGEVLILNDDKTLFHFQADLLKFFIVFADNLREIASGEETKNEVFSVYDDYHFSLRREDEAYVRILFNGQKKSLFTIKKLLHKIEAVKQKLYNDFKILYPDYEQLKNLDYLERKLVSL